MGNIFSSDNPAINRCNYINNQYEVLNTCLLTINDIIKKIKSNNTIPFFVINKVELDKIIWDIFTPEPFDSSKYIFAITSGHQQTVLHRYNDFISLGQANATLNGIIQPELQVANKLKIDLEAAKKRSKEMLEELCKIIKDNDSFQNVQDVQNNQPLPVTVNSAGKRQIVISDSKASVFKTSKNKEVLANQIKHDFLKYEKYPNIPVRRIIDIILSIDEYTDINSITEEFKNEQYPGDLYNRLFYILDETKSVYTRVKSQPRYMKLNPDDIKYSVAIGISNLFNDSIITQIVIDKYKELGYPDISSPLYDIFYTLTDKN